MISVRNSKLKLVCKCVFSITITFILSIIAGIAHSAEPQSTTQAEPMKSLSLKITVAPKLADLVSSSNLSIEDICESLGVPLQVDRGPWGFGLFSKIKSCRQESPSQPKSTSEETATSDPTIWELRIDQNQDGQATILLVRPRGADSEKIEAKVTLPTKFFLPELLSNKSLGLLLSATLLDQLPFRAKLTKKHVDSNFIANSQANDLTPFGLPQYFDTLIPVAVEISPSTGNFRVSTRNLPAEKLLTEKNIWLLSKKRGLLGKDLFNKISDSIERIAREQQIKIELSKNASKIFGRRERRKAKEIRRFWQRVETTAEIRGRASVLGSKDNALGLEGNLLFTESPFLNVQFGTHYLRAKIQFENSTQAGQGNSSSSQIGIRESFFATVGTGAHISLKNEHSIFFYPRLEMGKIYWKAEGTSSQLQEFDFEEKLFPEAGVELGYQTPEHWQLKWQARLAGRGLTSPVFSTFLFDVIGYIRSPLLYGATRNDVYFFALYEMSRLTKRSAINEFVNSFSVQTTDLAFGAGYRWQWF